MRKITIAYLEIHCDLATKVGRFTCHCDKCTAHRVWVHNCIYLAKHFPYSCFCKIVTSEPVSTNIAKAHIPITVPHRQINLHTLHYQSSIIHWAASLSLTCCNPPPPAATCTRFPWSLLVPALFCPFGSILRCYPCCLIDFPTNHISNFMAHRCIIYMLVITIRMRQYLKHHHYLQLQPLYHSGVESPLPNHPNSPS